MAQRFIAKRPQNKYVRPIRNSQIVRKVQSAEQPKVDRVAEKKEKNENTTMNSKIEQITQVLDTNKGSAPRRRVKMEKKDKGLIERTEDSTVLLTEDNKMLLND